MSKVSVIVPVYKADEWISECLRAIESQDYADIELVRIDDPEGSGAAAARNRGIEQATGDLIMFCDADDYLAEGAVSAMVAELKDADMVCGAFRKFGKFDQIVSAPKMQMSMGGMAGYAMGNLRNPRSNQMMSGCWAKLYRKALIGRFPEITTAEDMAFNYDYLGRCKKVRFTDTVVYHNRKRDGSLSTTFDETNKGGLFGFLAAMKVLRSFLIRYYPMDTVDEALDNSKVYHGMLYYMRICEQRGGSMRDNFVALYP